MSRVQLALNVTDLDSAVDFYSKLFGVPPHKRRDGYANFAVAEPPLKLVLMQGGAGGTINHLGVEVESTTSVIDANSRLRSEGLETRNEEGVNCCFAVQDKVWVSDPDGAPWEIYTILDDNPAPAAVGAVAGSECCGGAAESGCC